MKSVKVKAPYWEIAADLYFPDDFDASKKYPAIISAHPIGSCKEQTSGNVYGVALAKAGFIVIAFDASFQGESGGEPRYIEDPTLPAFVVAVTSIKAAIFQNTKNVKLKFLI